MKLSLSIPESDLEFIDGYASEHHVGSRSGVVQRAIALLRASDLGDDYAAAWADWDTTEAEAWDSAIGDGLG